MGLSFAFHVIDREGRMPAAGLLQVRKRNIIRCGYAISGPFNANANFLFLSSINLTMRNTGLEDNILPNTTSHN
jgi:hypothetical protein